MASEHPQSSQQHLDQDRQHAHFIRQSIRELCREKSALLSPNEISRYASSHPSHSSYHHHTPSVSSQYVNPPHGTQSSTIFAPSSPQQHQQQRGSNIPTKNSTSSSNSLEQKGSHTDLKLDSQNRYQRGTTNNPQNFDKKQDDISISTKPCPVLPANTSDHLPNNSHQNMTQPSQSQPDLYSQTSSSDEVVRLTSSFLPQNSFIHELRSPEYSTLSNNPRRDHSPVKHKNIQPLTIPQNQNQNQSHPQSDQQQQHQPQQQLPNSRPTQPISSSQQIAPSIKSTTTTSTISPPRFVSPYVNTNPQVVSFTYDPRRTPFDVESIFSNQRSIETNSTGFSQDSTQSKISPSKLTGKTTPTTTATTATTATKESKKKSPPTKPRQSNPQTHAQTNQHNPSNNYHDYGQKHTQSSSTKKPKKEKECDVSTLNRLLSNVSIRVAESNEQSKCQQQTHSDPLNPQQQQQHLTNRYGYVAQPNPAIPSSSTKSSTSKHSDNHQKQPQHQEQHRQTEQSSPHPPLLSQTSIAEIQNTHRQSSCNTGSIPRSAANDL